MTGTTVTDSYGWFFRGFVADLFGRLLPGILFLTASATALLWPLYVLIAKDTNVSCLTAISKNAPAIANLLNASWVLIIFVVLFLGYAFGHLFYRSEIKIPDQKSFKKIIDTNRSKKRPVEIPETDLACDKVATCEFPYPHLGDYLSKRKFNHLIPLAPWAKKGEEHRRTKKYIDILKIRIAFHDGESVNAIYRNEAHIRLSASIWFASSALCKVAATGLAIIIFVALTNKGLYGILDSRYYAPAFAPGLVLVVAIYCKSSVLESLHEMRAREIIFILETAYQLFSDKPEKLQDIAPEFKGAIYK
jgi:hypothetical protein